MQFYKPNASITGHAVGFQFNSKEGALYAQFVKQTGAKEFKDGKKFNLKFNAIEIGVLLNCIERGYAEKLYHQSEKGSTSIEVKEYFSKKKNAKDGFTISVNPRANEGEEKPDTFGFWFNAGEARTLKEYLQFVLDHFFAAEYSAEKQRRQEYTAKKGTATPKKEKVEKPDPLA